MVQSAGGLRTPGSLFRSLTINDSTGADRMDCDFAAMRNSGLAASALPGVVLWGAHAGAGAVFCSRAIAIVV